ncbi:MAG: nucleoside 2-deoxyribosyltransferase [Proteobacteria bacterium]|nr:nucleoside 2-deoxyribosyltransferase [Pseudomonadota bacterium]
MFAQKSDFSSRLFATVCITMFRGVLHMNIYLAGPDVFRADALAWAEESRQLCAVAGHRALIPLDAEETTAAGIYLANRELIRRADALLANLNPFRGCEPDSGTCVEVGMALALGKPVIGYVDRAETTAQRVARVAGGKLAQRGGRPIDGAGWYVEDFGLPLNLMLAVPVTIVVGGLAAAVHALSGQRSVEGA